MEQVRLGAIDFGLGLFLIERRECSDFNALFLLGQTPFSCFHGLALHPHIFAGGNQVVISQSHLSDHGDHLTASPLLGTSDADLVHLHHHASGIDPEIAQQRLRQVEADKRAIEKAGIDFRTIGGGKEDVVVAGHSALQRVAQTGLRGGQALKPHRVVLSPGFAARRDKVARVADAGASPEILARRHADRGIVASKGLTVLAQRLARIKVRNPDVQVLLQSQFEAVVQGDGLQFRSRLRSGRTQHEGGQKATGGADGTGPDLLRFHCRGQ